MRRRQPAIEAKGQLPTLPGDACLTCPRPCLTGFERLVGLGFRSWLAGYQTGDIACWEHAWDAYARELGSTRAKAAITELSCWVRTINLTSHRNIEIYPGPCANFCGDECMAVSMIAASQHDQCPALQACASTLLGHSDVGLVMDDARSFGVALRGLDVVLSPHAVIKATQ